ncbi:MAG: TMEM254 family protein [Candidatus Binataceae bacterium]
MDTPAKLEVPERDVLLGGFFWMGLGLLASLPWIGPSWLGEAARFLIVISVLIHIGEGIYAQTLAARIGEDTQRWFRRTLVMGYLAVRILQRAQPPMPSVGAPPSAGIPHP